MIDNSTSKLIDIITDTKISKIKWARIDYFKEKTESIGINLSYLPNIHSYMKMLQSERFIIDFENSYVSIYEHKMMILAKSKYSSDIRLDVLNAASSTFDWKRIKVRIPLLLTLRNIIQLTENNKDNSDALLNNLSFFYNYA